jgi:septal ring factor EnvC (AmiA/AmiB activator)
MVNPSRERVHLVVERTDGSRIVRLPAPRWLVSVAVALTGLVLVSAGALYRDYVTLTADRADFAALQSRLREQQALIEGFQDRVAQMRAEVDGWRVLRSRIWQPFGPEGDPAAARLAGVGGTALRHMEPPPAAAPLPLLDELERVSGVVTEEGESLRALERFIAKAGRVLTSLPSRWPVRGPVNSDFGPRLSPWLESSGEYHSGLDIGAARGTPVTAPAPGTVVFTGPHAEYGIALIIDHGHDIKTLYGHLSRVEVPLGQAIERGQVVALTGNTGRSSGPHLHYEIQVAGKAVNPRLYLWD